MRNTLELLESKTVGMAAMSILVVTTMIQPASATEPTLGDGIMSSIEDEDEHMRFQTVEQVLQDALQLMSPQDMSASDGAYDDFGWDPITGGPGGFPGPGNP